MLRFLRRRVRRKKHFARKNILETSKKTNAVRVRAALAFSPPFKFYTRFPDRKKGMGRERKIRTIFSCHGFVNHDHISTADRIASSISTAGARQEGTAGAGRKNPRDAAPPPYGRGRGAGNAGRRRGAPARAGPQAEPRRPPRGGARASPEGAQRRPKGDGGRGAPLRRARQKRRSRRRMARTHPRRAAGPKAAGGAGPPRSDGGAHNRRAARRGGLYARLYR